MEVNHYGRSIGLDEARKAVKQLQSLFGYARKLPVQPITIADWTAVILAHHKVSQTIRMIVYADTKSRPELSNEEASMEYVLGTIDRRAGSLMPALLISKFLKIFI